MQFARVGALVGAAVAAVAATVFAAVPASAHTPIFTPGCDGEKSTLTVHLKDYQVKDGKTNTVVVSVDGKELKSAEFGREYKETFTEPGDVKHTFAVKVKAWDDPSGDKGWTKEYSTEVAACVKVVTSTTTTTTTVDATTTTTAPETTPESSAPVTTTTSAAAVVVAGDANPLANTGASIAIPLVIGLVLLGGGAALLIVLRKRAANNN
ncbi:LPXTG cell wall anchor domain-containing protein [Actinosynnema sp. NPDC051121]|nr:LPXTG cell wall anchor domain-containing protein [Saccharothrix sp.]